MYAWLPRAPVAVGRQREKRFKAGGNLFVAGLRQRNHECYRRIVGSRLRPSSSSGAMKKTAVALLLIMLSLLLLPSPGDAAAAAGWWQWWPGSASDSADQSCDAVGDPYTVLGVVRGTEPSKVTKAYRKLAMKWHPDKNRGSSEAEDRFAQIANAYDVLTDPEKREIFDRLGQDGLDRLRDGDPSVQKDWIPPKEPPKQGIDRLIAAIARGSAVLRDALGLANGPPVVRITAVDTHGNMLRSGGATSGGKTTFKFDLSDRPYDKATAALTSLRASAITHNCPTGFRFLGMKTTYYLECPHAADLIVRVKVAAETFVSRGGKRNLASSTFSLLMI